MSNLWIWETGCTPFCLSTCVIACKVGSSKLVCYGKMEKWPWTGLFASPRQMERGSQKGTGGVAGTWQSWDQRRSR